MLLQGFVVECGRWLSKSAPNPCFATAKGFFLAQRVLRRCLEISTSTFRSLQSPKDCHAPVLKSTDSLLQRRLTPRNRYLQQQNLTCGPNQAPKNQLHLKEEGATACSLLRSHLQGHKVGEQL